MALSPQDIVRKEFREALRGYNQADVDLFLDEVVEEFSALSEENQRMKVRIAALQQEVARLRESRGGAVPAATAADPSQVESEVRTRVRRFLEEQIRLLDAGGAAPARGGATVDRIARDISAGVEERPEEGDRSSAGTPSSEPFWAGE